MIRDVALFCLISLSFRVYSQEIISSKSITSTSFGGIGSYIQVKPGHANNFMLTASSWGGEGDSLIYADNITLLNDTSLFSDLYRQHILVNENGTYINHFQSARYNFNPPEFINGEYLMSGHYPGYVTGLIIGGKKFEKDSSYAANKSYTLGVYACALDTQFMHEKSINITTESYGGLSISHYDSGYYLTGIVGSDMIWNSDSLHTQSVDSFSRNFSFIANLDKNFNLRWRHYAFHLDVNFDSSNSRTFKSGLPSVVIPLSGGKSILFVYNAEGVEYMGDTVVSPGIVSGIGQTIPLLIDSNGLFLKTFQFKELIESEHLDAVSNGVGTILHFVGYKESFTFKGVQYPWGRYFVFYDDTLGVKRIINNPYAQSITAASDGGFYWTGQIKQNANFDSFSVQATNDDQKVVVAKISPKGDYLWVKAVDGGMEMSSITENNKRIACTGRAYQHITYQNDTLIKLASSPLKTSGLLILEDRHVVGEAEVISEEARLKVYPNPSNTSFHLEWEFENEVSLSVFDISGSKILSKSDLDSKAGFSFSPEYPGVFIIQVSDGKHSMLKKVVKL